MADAKRRTSSLSPPEFYLLRLWGEALRHAFGHSTYLVGSVARDEAWRDVDMRMMLPDEHPLLALGDGTKALNVAMSLWGQRATGLPIDFQFQSTTEGNGGDNGNGRRLPMRMPRGGGVLTHGEPE